MNGLPRFDALFCISDLHMGGSSGFQIFDQGDLLARWIESISVRTPEDSVALVINGDMVDFLADKAPTYFDPFNAICKLESIVKDQAFARVWESLQTFVSTRNRHLIVTIGNHDLELALPWVREWFLHTLSRGDDAARGRITLSLDGAGYLCLVGDEQLQCSVYCVHGNDVDEWNYTDYERLRRIGRDIQLKGPQSYTQWIPNAGTQLVIDVMNGIKRTYPFVDLLKPETETVTKVLYMFEGIDTRALSASLKYARSRWDRFRGRHQLLGESAKSGGEAALESGAGEYGGSLADSDVNVLFGQLADAQTSAAELTEAESELLIQRAHERRNRRKVDGATARGNAGGSPDDEFLGLFGAMWKGLTGAESSEILRKWLDGLLKDESFCVTNEDETFKRIDEVVRPDVDVVITGHTHLRRARRRTRGSGFYFNSGTWALLMRFNKSDLEDATQFERVFEGIRSSSLSRVKEKLAANVVRQPTVVSITNERAEGSTTVSATLMEIKSGDKKKTPVDIVPVEGAPSYSVQAPVGKERAQ